MTPTLDAAMFDEAEIKQFIRKQFAENLEMLQYEYSQNLTREAQEAAMNQVLVYWLKMGDVAKKITDTEVKLSLPNQITPQGRKFGIEGVVDVVRQEGHTAMYDIKSHDVDYIRANTELYEQQLNVYAHIWQTLQGQTLDYTAIIATAYPARLQDALIRDDALRLNYEIDKWSPLVVLSFDEERIHETIIAFGETVDKIENREFAPPPTTKLQEKVEGTRTEFGRRICRECDVRFSCSSYRDYAIQSGHGNVEERFLRFFSDYGNDLALEVRRTNALDTLHHIDTDIF